MNAIRAGDYSTLLKDNSLKKEINIFCMSDWKTIDDFLRDCDFLYVAIKQDKYEQSTEELRKLLGENNSSLISEKNVNVKRTLEILLKEADDSFKITEKLMQRIDNLCNGRYKSDESKKIFEQERKNYTEDVLEKFYNKNRVKDCKEKL